PQPPLPEDRLRSRRPPAVRFRAARAIRAEARGKGAGSGVAPFRRDPTIAGPGRCGKGGARRLLPRPPVTGAPRRARASDRRRSASPRARAQAAARARGRGRARRRPRASPLHRVTGEPKQALLLLLLE